MQASILLRKEPDGDPQRLKAPLADLLRPKSIDEIIGQDHLLAGDASLGHMIRSGNIASMILWGPPGTGKTTLAKIIANSVAADFTIVSAVTSNVSELKQIFTRAKINKTNNRSHILMVDEIHHLNRSQQDIFLPYIEDGTIILIGATTENPSFELNGALLSRSKIFVLNLLDNRSLMLLIERAENFYGKKIALNDEACATLCNIAAGDGRYLLGLCEQLYNYNNQEEFDSKALLKILHEKPPLYDKNRDQHYNIISALHKSVRGSDVDAALYWLARMLNGGENPLYILRRMVRCAVEDIGMADPNALLQAIAAKDAYDFLGSPEGELAIAQCVVYLATAPKSNSVYKAFNLTKKEAMRTNSLSPPKHILNAPTKMMKDQGYGAGYQYDHDAKNSFSGQDYLPEQLKNMKYYSPVELGFEREIKKRLDYWSKLKIKSNVRLE